VFVDSLILFGTDQHLEGKHGSLYAVHRTRGELVWKVPLDPGLPTDLRYASGLVYGVSLDDRLLAFDPLTGAQAWSHASTWARGVPASGDGNPKLASSCQVVADLVCYAGRDDVVYGVRARTGERVWATTPGGRITTQIANTSGLLACGTDDFRLHFLEPLTGRSIHAMAPLGPNRKTGAVLDMIAQETMAYADGFLYFLAGFEPTEPVDLVAWDMQTSKIAWRQTAPDNSRDAHWFVPRLPFWHGAVVAGSTHGLVVAYDLRTGAEQWRHQLEGPIRGIGTTADMIFVGNLDGVLFALRRAP
jgi:outer membrane protein assembly factor BamB